MAQKRKAAAKKAKAKPAAESKPALVPEDPPAEVQAETPSPAAKPKQRRRRYGFLTVSRCPRCGSTHTRAYSTQGRVQYRQCLVPICRKRYTVFGTKV